MSRSRTFVPALLAAALALGACGARPADAPGGGASPASPAYDDAFWKAWGDGRAELAGYDFVTPRYGSLRRGIAVAVFVTETFSNSARVKADPGRHPKSDEFPVLKLNLVQDFATGIYDYNLMTSAFVALAPVNGRPAGVPTKVSFSSQEWCGNVYAQVELDPRTARLVSHSYFDGEADRDTTLAVPDDATSEDALFVWARGLAAPVLAPGETRTVPMLRSLRAARLLHQPEIVQRVTLSRAALGEPVTVPAGTFDVETLTARVENGRTWTFWVERAAPHRLIQWTCSDGEKAQLLGADRLKYWEMHDPGGEAALAKLGLRPRADRMP